MQLAQALFDEARKLMAKGHWAEACPKLAESQRLDPGGGTLLNLAVCNEHIGKLAAAQVQYSDALSIATREKNTDRETFAEQHLEALAPRVPKLTLRLACEGQPLALDRSVAVDGAMWSRPALGVPISVDPGEHVILVRSKDVSAKPIRVTVKEGELRSETLDCNVEARRVSHVQSSKRSVAFWVTLGAAGALGVASGITGGVALGYSNSAKDKCNFDRNYCATAEGRDDASSARTWAWVSTGLLAGSIVTAAVAFFLPKAKVLVAVSPTGTLEVGGRF